MPTLGETLRDARGKKKAKLSQVEADTRIARDKLEALESDRLDALPDDVYTRGAIRNYALYLGLDADQTLALYRDARPAQVVARPLSQVGTVTRLTPLTYAMISALTVILVVVALFVTHII
ncbi:MAG TPA: helix-turn-helix domain-containing protein [Chloroflexota bacterium]